MAHNKTYIGTRGPAGALVYVDGKPLRPRWDLRNHSPDGFEWGYGGSGPSQLALAPLADHFGDDHKALDLYQLFKWSVIAEIHSSEWQLTSAQIDSAISEIEASEKLA